MVNLVVILLSLIIKAAAESALLKEDNFDSYIDGAPNVLVKFFAPWYRFNATNGFLICKGRQIYRCAHCRNFSPEWEAVQKQFLSYE